MPTQEEELRLTVNLVDNASAGLTRLREEMQQIGGGASAQATEKFKREQTELNKVVKQFSSELGDSFKAFGAMRSALGIGATAVGVFGAEMVRQMNALKEYSDKIRGIGIAAREIGLNPGVLRNLIDQFAQVGVSTDDVVSGMGNVQGKIADLQREGSELWSKMVGEAGQVGSKAQASMNAFLQRLTQARSESEQLNMIRQAGENIYQNRLRDTGNQQEAINARNQFWANLGYNARLAELKQVKELTDAERKRQEELAEAAKAYADSLDKTKSIWSDIVDISNKPMLENLKATLDYINPMLEKFRDFFQWMNSGPKPPPGLTGLTEKHEIERLPGANDSFWTKFGDWWSNAPKTEEERKKAIEDNTKALQEQRDTIKELNDRIKQGQPGGGYQPSSFGGAGFDRSMVQQAAFRTPSGGAPMFGGGGTWGGGGAGGGGGGGGWEGFGGLPSGGGGVAGFGPGRAGIPQREGGAPYGSSTGGPTGLPQSGPAGDPSVPSDILAQAKRVAMESGPGGVERFMAQNGYPKAGAWCGEFAASVVKSVGGTPPAGAAIASNWRNWGTPVDTPQPGDIAVRRGARTGSTGSHVTFVESVDPKTGKFIGLGGNQAGGRLTGSQFGISRYEFRRATGMPPNGQTAGPGTGAGAGDTPANTSAGKITGGGSVNEAIRSTAGTAGMDEAHWKAIASIESSLNPSSNINARTQYKGLFQIGSRGADSEWARMGRGNIYDPQANAEAAARLAADNNARFKRRFGRDPTPTETYMMHQQGLGFYTKGTMTNVAGNPYPGMRGPQTPQSFEAGWGREIERRAATFSDRQQLDRSQAASTKVEGTGKISVDVNAPKGTKVDAEGGGLFKDVEVNRQTQMEPARRGPAQNDEVLSI